MVRGELRPRLTPILIASFVALNGTAAVAADHRFAIAPQSLASALAAFGRQSGDPILFQEEATSNVRSPGVAGRLESEAALAGLLRGLPFEYRRVGRGFVVTRTRETAPAARSAPATTPVRAPAADPARPAPPGPLDEVVVTGALVRGVSPAGNQVVLIGRDDLVRAGVVQTNQLLSTIPQMAGFNAVVRTQTLLQGVTSYRPNLRNLPPLQNGTTLILLDSHNLVGGAIQQNFTDVGALPPGAIERVEVVLDGGSATYGSDAVGGVMNFVTRSHFDGLQLSAKAGAAGPNFHSYTAELLGGRDWSGGGAVVAISTRKNDALVGADRDFPRQDLTPYGGSDFRVRTCAPGNVVVGGVAYALPDLTVGANLCDNDRQTAIMPWERQSSGFLSVSQSLSPDVDFQLKAFGARRTTRTPAAQLAESAAVVTAANPFFRPIGAETQQTVAFSWAPVLGPTTTSELRLAQFDVSPTLTWRMEHGWETRVLLDYGRSHLTQKVPQLNTTAETAALRGPGLTAASALNPYDLNATNPAVLTAITDYWNFARSNQSMQTARVIADGPVLTLPGGQVRVAVGAQFQHISSNSLAVAGPVDGFGSAVTARRARGIGGLFGELAVPLVGPDSGRRFVNQLDLDFSARYNDYQGIGSTLDPKIGLTWQVDDELKLRGNWGKAFVAPGLNDTPPGGTDSTVLIAATTTNLRPGDPLTDRNRPNIVLTGGTAGVKPVTAQTWSVGAELHPARFEGLEFNLTYWSIRMKDLIQAGCINALADQLADPRLNGVCYYYKPTLEQALALTSGYRILFGAGTSVASLYGAGNDPYYIQDRRRRNYGGFNSTGLDFNATYRRPTDWGSVYGTIGGVRYLTREQQQVQGGPFVDLLAANNPKIALQALVGVDIGRFTATATMFHTGGYAVTSVAGQSRVKGFSPLNLFFRYRVGEELDLTINVDNVFDANPPFINQSSGLAGSTIGRYTSVGVRRQF